MTDDPDYLQQFTGAIEPIGLLKKIEAAKRLIESCMQTRDWAAALAALGEITHKQPDAELRATVLAYLSECDNPVPDYSYRRQLRDRLRKLVGAPDEPKE